MHVIEHSAMDVPMQEFFNSGTNEFITIPAKHIDGFRLVLEHSLLSIRKWEAKWHKPFMEETQMGIEEFRDYIRCMTINTPKSDEVYSYLTQTDLDGVVSYISDPMSAWEIRKKKKKPGKKEKMTAEYIYAAMIASGVPFEAEKWHLNQLLALLDVCENNGTVDGYKTGKPKSQREIMDLYHSLNQKNRKKYNSKG